MDQHHQQQQKHRDLAGTIEIPSATWIKLVTIQKVLAPESSKRKVVLDLIDQAHTELLEQMGDMMSAAENGGKP
jgi:hypothetical protein